MSNPTSAFISDRPERLDAAERDVFGHGDYADALSKALTEVPAPFTIGVFGAWGVGKSTILGALKERLPDSCTFAFFDAWRYENEAAIRRQFLLDIGRQLEEQGQLRRFTVKEDLRDLDVEVSETEDSGIGFSWPRFLRSLVAGLILGALVYLLLRWKETAEFFSGPDAPEDAGVSLLVVLLGLAATYLIQPLQVTQRVLSARRLEEPDQFTRKFEQMMGSVKAPRVVIAIDNLDRCSPAHAVEVLSTIKTYLEPALESDETKRFQVRLWKKHEPKEAVFLIAADHAALKRHLVSQECAVAPQENPDAIGRYVDEYLRKFFNATVPVRELLDDDMRRYVERNLGSVLGNLEKEDGAQLIEMVAAALRRNPRRVVQFANNLQLRLRLIRARETKGPDGVAKMNPPISDNVLMVAKLLLIEEEWPRWFAGLQDQPRLLDEWQEQARVRADEHRTDEFAEEDSESDWESFAAFLRISVDVTAHNIRAFLRLKQSQEEIGLPGYREFGDAVVSGRTDDVESLLEEADPALRSRYAERLVRLLDEELAQKWISGARSVVDVALTAAPFESEVDAVNRVLTKAAWHPQLRLEVLQLDPHRVLNVAARLPQAPRETLFRTLAEDYRNRVVQRQPALPPYDEAFASVLPSVDAKSRAFLSEAIDSEEAACSEYVTLAEADPTILTEGAVTKAVTAVVGTTVEPPQLVDDPDTLRVVRAALSADLVSPEAQDRLIAHVQAALGAARDKAPMASLPKLLDEVEPLIGQLREGSVDAYTELATAVAPYLVTLEPKPSGRLLRFVTTFIGRVKPNKAVAVTNSLVQHLFQSNATTTVDAIAESPDLIPAAFKPSTASFLVDLSASNPGLAPACAKALVALSPDELPKLLAQTTANSVSRGNYDFAREALSEWSDVLRERQQEVIQPILDAAAKTAPRSRETQLRVLADLGKAVKGEQGAELRRLLREQLNYPETTALAVELAPSLKDDDAHPEWFREYVEEAFGLLEPLSELTPAHGPLLEFVAANANELPTLRRQELIGRLVSWAANTKGIENVLTGAIRRLPDLTPDERRDLVQSLLVAERIDGLTVAARHIYLATALRIKGHPNSRAAKAIKVRLHELANSDNDDDAAVGQGLS